MIAPTVEDRLRHFLLVLAALVFAATVGELALVEHTEGFVQITPFILCGIGLVAVLAIMWWPVRSVLLVGRVILVIVAIGSVYGWYEHVAHNLAFELEIRPGSTTSDVLWEALSGASPLLAPGILALGALMAVVGTYRHPVLVKSGGPFARE